MEETQFSYVPASAALQVYGCGVLITVGAALCFSSRQRRHLQSTRADISSSQFISANNKLASLESADDHGRPGALVQPLLPEVAV